MSDANVEVVWAACVGWDDLIEVGWAKVKRTEKCLTILECSNSQPFHYRKRLDPSEVSSTRTEAIRTLISSLYTKLDDLDKESKEIRQNIEKAELAIEDTKESK